MPDPIQTRARFAVSNPECLHSPAEYREIIGELLAGNDRAREINRVLLAECRRLRAFLAESHKMIDRGGFHRQPADMAGAD